MKSLEIPFIKELSNVQQAVDILEEKGRRDILDCVNWYREFPYKPLTDIYVGRSEKALFIKYCVKGSMLKAVYTNDHDPVWQDSCVEFFCMPEGAERYANFEFNCIGTCLATSRKSRNEDVVPFTPEEMKTIERYPSLGRRAFKEMEGMFEWDLTVKIPFKLMGLDGNNLPGKIRANFYKCADDTDSVHYVSWSPIHTETPDFHRPDFFGELVLG